MIDVLNAAAVYPRVYGESAAAGPLLEAAAGLSPRVRGILLHICAIVSLTGSIPACTGNPDTIRGW